MSKIFWIDTEFNGSGGAFISAALVAEDGTCWYKSVGCKNPVPWVKKNVMPIIGIRPVKLFSLQKSLYKFLNQYDEITIIADHFSDIEYFCHLMLLEPLDGSIIRTPPITFQVKTHILGNSRSAIPHNALEDAKAIMKYDLEYS